MAQVADGDPVLALTNAVLKLARQIEGTERSIMALARRFNPPEPAQFDAFSWDKELNAMMVARGPKNVQTALAGLEIIKRYIRGMDTNLAAIRALIDDLLNDAGAERRWRLWQAAQRSGGGR